MKRTVLSLLVLAVFAGETLAATDVKVTFALNTTDVNGVPTTQNRSYWIYRPDNLPRTIAVPMIPEKAVEPLK